MSFAVLAAGRDRAACRRSPAERLARSARPARPAAVQVPCCSLPAIYSPSFLMLTGTRTTNGITCPFEQQSPAPRAACM